MAVLQVRAFRLVPRGDAGLACDEEGIALGAVRLASVDPRESGGRRRRCEVRSLTEIQAILHLAYGVQSDETAKRCQRGLLRAAAAIEPDAIEVADPGLSAEGLATIRAVSELL